ncbi:MAG: hypothetical protein ABR499_13655 [Gemmatimonadaceae bacterium]
MRFRGMSTTVVGAATLLLALSAPELGSQTRRLGVLRPAPRPQVGPNAGRPRLGFISPHFFTTCFFTPSVPFFPLFGGGVPFVNIQIFAGNQAAPDPTSHLTPDPNAHPVAFPGSHPLPGMQPVPGSQPVPGLQPVPGGVTTNPHAAPVFAPPVYSAPVYSAPTYSAATPVATPQVSGGMVVGDVIVDPTFSLWGSSFFFGGGFACVPTRFLGGSVIVR